MTLIWLLKWRNFRAQDFYGVAMPSFGTSCRKCLKRSCINTKAGSKLLHTQLKALLAEKSVR